jgi:NADPH2:quinone reductase
MRAIRPAEPGGPEVLQPVELPTPSPGPGQALVEVHFAGVNFIDVYHRTGAYPLPRPLPLGREGAGRVVAVGDGVRGVEPGAFVAWCDVAGSYATHVVAPADRLVTIPEDVSVRDAAALMLQGLTAHYLARSTFSLGLGQLALLHAAAGGVGLLLAQLAAAAGATVIGTVSSEAKAARARAAGCAHVVRYDRDDFVAAVRELSGGRGVDVVYDSVGQATFLRSLECLRPRGLAVLFGQSSGPVAPLDLQLLNARGSLFVTRPNLSHHVSTRAELAARADEVFTAVAAGALAVTIDRCLPLAQAAEAHRLLESRATSGKLLLDATAG